MTSTAVNRSAELYRRAGGGDRSAWQELVAEFGPLIRIICRRNGVRGADADDVGGAVWLQFVRRMTSIREPAALPGWLATTAHRECVALSTRRRRQWAHVRQAVVEPVAPSDTKILAEERWAALRSACSALSERDRQLLSLVFADPPLPYVEIGARLGMPHGAIGPTRQRCLARIRRNPRVAALLDDG